MPSDFKVCLAFLDEKVKKTGAQYKAFGIFGALNFPIYYLVWLYISPQTYENFPVRGILTLLFLVVLLD